MWFWKYIDTKKCNLFLLSLHLFDCKDEKKYIKVLYSISNNIKKNYKIYTIKKKNGKERTIYEPSPLLKKIQKNILHNILENKAISKYAKAYHKGISLKENAVDHVKKKIILKLDIHNFFESISFFDIYNCCFPIVYFPKSVGMLFTNLVTYQGHLTQGSPTSAYISNLVMKDFDEVLGLWCQKQNISYTRYSDDMTFSGTFHPTEVIQKVRKMLRKLGLQLNEEKTKVVTQSKCQYVTGIVVNEKIRVCKHTKKQIRQEMYYMNKFGVQEHLKRTGILKEPSAYLKSLYGKILYVLQIEEANPEFLEYKIFLKQMMEEKL